MGRETYQHIEGACGQSKGHELKRHGPKNIALPFNDQKQKLVSSNC
jgi:hypothetical protein